MIDPTVKKILNNGGFIAALAPVLVKRLDNGSKLHSAVSKLAEAAAAYAQMIGVLEISRTPENDWGGCDQAKALLRWIHLPGNSVTSTAEYDAFVEQVDGWTSAIWSAIADLAAGKIPG